MWVELAREQFTDPEYKVSLRGLYDDNLQDHFLEGNRYSWYHVLQMDIEQLEFRSRISNRLKATGINTVGDLMEWNEIELGDISMFGGGTVNTIKVRLARWGLKLSEHKWDDPLWIDVWPNMEAYGYSHRVPRERIGRFSLSRVLRLSETLLRPSLDPEAVSIVEMACEQLTVSDVQQLTLIGLRSWAHEFGLKFYCSEEDQGRLLKLVELIREWLHQHELLP